MSALPDVDVAIVGGGVGGIYTGWRRNDLFGVALEKRDIAERVLGHAIPGVEGVYDRHHYDEQKGAALLALAGIIQNSAGLDNSTVGPITTIRAEGSLDRYGAAAQS